MIELLNPDRTLNCTTTRLFYYRNTTNQIQIMRVEQTMPQRFEKVVFPGEQVLFYATSAAFLDIYVNGITSLNRVKQIPCTELQIIETEQS
ncbi:DUF1830 domain-containing protein [Oscillatoria sp. FACHB-1407]|uniref:DUF1830 domain-containing protein n=1 Tax=Oscillatoria sp. FACHB-1407 TaxID=2692847 RepID=UPI0016897DC8|nr:DUF1830 domain-containing protein [Oscillatoria sp. FACHB-1407]MBD2464684.1 DUF1830 domain-containing protein [Oscillatoria sp. FACHB-1407]